MARRASKRVVYAALIGNLLVAATKFVAAALTGSSAMASEAVHSLVDTGNEVLLLHGLRRAAVPPDEQHPLGHGRELYFWSFVVTIVIFALGAGVSLYQGVRHVLAPAPMSNPVVNYVVLGLAGVFEASSWLVAVREFRAVKGRHGYIEAVQRSKDPTVFVVLFEDTAALIGIGIAAVGIAASEVLHRPVLDGAASIGIGLLLGAVSIFLARESKGLLIGEPADSSVVASICAIAREHPGVERADGLFTVHLAPEQIVAAITADFTDTLSAADVETAVSAIEDRVRAKHPDIILLLVKPQGSAVLARVRSGGSQSK
ncbi:MAG TPA: cation diffusion facilitator family transporter [Methylomirabilota bacterium]|nr:cation diffusion facilitator family transporter [Methylomirabilota bacterium]